MKKLKLQKTNKQRHNELKREERNEGRNRNGDKSKEAKTTHNQDEARRTNREGEISISWK